MNDDSLFSLITSSPFPVERHDNMPSWHTFGFVEKTLLHPDLINRCEFFCTYSITFMHLADAFIQSDFHCIQAIHFFFNQYVCSLGIEPTTFCAANAMLYHWATGTYGDGLKRCCGLQENFERIGFLFKGSPPKNEKLILIYSDLGHYRCRWLFFLE